MDRDVAATVLGRDVWCAWCGARNVNPALHHRRLPGRVDHVQNVVAICHACHNGRRDSVHLSPAVAYERGLLVHSWDDPADVPIVLLDGGKVWLSAGGGYRSEGEG